MAEVTSGKNLTVLVLDEAEAAALERLLSDDRTPELSSLREALWGW